MRFLFTALTLVCLLSSSAHAQESSYTRALLGKWTGTLDYRDFSSDARVTLPTTLEVKPGPAGTLVLRFVYDDGPGKIVVSTDTLRLDLAAATYRLASDDGSTSTYHVDHYAEQAGAFALTLAGQGEENGTPVEVRLTVALAPGAYSVLRETQIAGADFRFRHQYRFTRAAEAP